MARVRHALGHRVEYLERRHDFPGPVDVHSQASATHLVHVAGEIFGGGSQARKVLGPGGNHLPLEVFVPHRGPGDPGVDTVLGRAPAGPQADRQHQGRYQQ